MRDQILEAAGWRFAVAALISFFLTVLMFQQWVTEPPPAKPRTFQMKFEEP